MVGGGGGGDRCRANLCSSCKLVQLQVMHGPDGTGATQSDRWPMSQSRPPFQVSNWPHPLQLAPPFGDRGVDRACGCSLHRNIVGGICSWHRGNAHLEHIPCQAAEVLAQTVGINAKQHSAKAQRAGDRRGHSDPNANHAPPLFGGVDTMWPACLWDQQQCLCFV